MWWALFPLLLGLGLLVDPLATLISPGRVPPLESLSLEAANAASLLIGGALVGSGLLALMLPWPRDRRHSARGRWEAVAVALSFALLVGGVGFALVELEYVARPPLALVVNGGLGLVLTLLGLALVWAAIGGVPSADRTGTGSTDP